MCASSRQLWQTNPGRFPDAARRQPGRRLVSSRRPPPRLPPASSLRPLCPLACPPLHRLITLPAGAFVPKTCHGCCSFPPSDYPPGGISLACKMHLAEPGRISGKCIPRTNTSLTHSCGSIHGARASGSAQSLGLKLRSHVVHTLLSSSAWALHVAPHPTLTPPSRAHF